MNSVALKEVVQPRSNDDLWSPEQTETLVRMWTVEGKPGSEIGRVVNKTRSAVMGKIARMKLRRPGETPAVPEPVADVPVAEVIPLPRILASEAPQAAGGLPLPPVAPPRAPIAPIPDIIGDEQTGDDEDEDGDDKDDRGGFTIPLNEAPPAAPKVASAPKVETKAKAAPKAEAPAPFKASPVEAAFPVALSDPDADLPAGPKPGQNVAVTSALRASDGGEGMLLMRATAFECKFPLWADNTPIDKKRVCGCKVVTGKSWCKTHFDVVFEPPRKR
jgi:Meckel syndrome type 1 protein